MLIEFNAQCCFVDGKWQRARWRRPSFALSKMVFEIEVSFLFFFSSSCRCDTESVYISHYFSHTKFIFVRIPKCEENRPRKKTMWSRWRCDCGRNKWKKKKNVTKNEIETKIRRLLSLMFVACVKIHAFTQITSGARANQAKRFTNEMKCLSCHNYHTQPQHFQLAQSHFSSIIIFNSSFHAVVVHLFFSSPRHSFSTFSSQSLLNRSHENHFRDFPMNDISHSFRFVSVASFLLLRVSFVWMCLCVSKNNNRNWTLIHSKYSLFHAIRCTVRLMPFSFSPTSSSPSPLFVFCSTLYCCGCISWSIAIIAIVVVTIVRHRIVSACRQRCSAINNSSSPRAPPSHALFTACVCEQQIWVVHAYNKPTNGTFSVARFNRHRRLIANAIVSERRSNNQSRFTGITCERECNRAHKRQGSATASVTHWRLFDWRFSSVRDKLTAFPAKNSFDSFFFFSFNGSTWTRLILERSLCFQSTHTAASNEFLFYLVGLCAITLTTFFITSLARRKIIFNASPFIAHNKNILNMTLSSIPRCSFYFHVRLWNCIALNAQNTEMKWNFVYDPRERCGVRSCLSPILMMFFV